MDYENLVPADAQAEGAKKEPAGKMHMQGRKKMKGITMRDLIELAMLVSEMMKLMKILVEMERDRLTSPPEAQWMDSGQMRSFLKTNRATMQNLRDKGILPFSRVNGKLYYKTTDILTILESNYENERRRKMKKG